MSYLKSAQRKDPPPPRVCVVDIDHPIFIAPGVTISCKLPTGQPGPGAKYSFGLHVDVNIPTLPHNALINCTWIGCTGPATVLNGHSLDFFPGGLNSGMVGLQLASAVPGSGIIGVWYSPDCRRL